MYIVLKNPTNNHIDFVILNLVKVSSKIGVGENKTSLLVIFFFVYILVERAHMLVGNLGSGVGGWVGRVCGLCS